VTVSTLERVAAGVRAAADDAVTDVNGVQSTPFTALTRTRWRGRDIQEWQYEVRESGAVVTVSVAVWEPTVIRQGKTA
jgi:hypothetical protein